MKIFNILRISILGVSKMTRELQHISHAWYNDDQLLNCLDVIYFNEMLCDEIRVIKIKTIVLIKS